MTKFNMYVLGIYMYDNILTLWEETNGYFLYKIINISSHLYMIIIHFQGYKKINKV